MATTKKYYWSKIEEVYHDNQKCPSGVKITTENRVDGDVAPAGRELCEHCHE
jgi:hypothetical protein